MLKEFQNQFILSSETPFALPILLKPKEIPFCHQETELLGYIWTAQNSDNLQLILHEANYKIVDYQYHEMLKLSLFLQQEE